MMTDDILRSATRHSPRHASFVGYVGFENLGDEVIWNATRQSLAPASLRITGCLVRFSPIRPATWRFRSLFRRILKFDLAILGGGTLIRKDKRADGNSLFRPDFEWAASISKRSIVFGTGVDLPSIDTAKNAWLEQWRPCLRKCDYIGVRGPHSVESLRTIGIKAEPLGDIACLFAKPSGFWKPQDRVLGINVGYVPSAFSVSLQQYNSLMTRFIQARIQEGWDIEIFLVCPDDEPVALTLQESVASPRLKIHPYFRDAENYLQSVRRMRAFIGVKLHSVVLAMCAGVPSIMMEYDPKCSDFMSSMNLEQLVAKLESTTPEQLQEHLETLLKQSDELGSAINLRMNQTRVRIEQRAAQIRSGEIFR